MPIHAPVPLFEPHRVPRDLLVENVPAGGLEVQPLRGRVGRDKDPDRGVLVVERGLDRGPVRRRVPPEEGLDLWRREPRSGEPGHEVVERVLVLREDDQPLVPSPQVLPDPCEEQVEPGVRWKRPPSRAAVSHPVSRPAEAFEGPADPGDVRREDLTVRAEPGASEPNHIRLAAPLLLVVLYRGLCTAPRRLCLVHAKAGKVEPGHVLPPGSCEGVGAREKPFRQEREEKLRQHPFPSTPPS